MIWIDVKDYNNGVKVKPHGIRLFLLTGVRWSVRSPWFFDMQIPAFTLTGIRRFHTFTIMETDFFKGIKQWAFFQADDREGKLPCFYYDTTSLTAIYTAATREIRALLPRKEMYPLEVIPGRCLIAFTAFEYRKTDIDPYNEFAISFPISYNRPQIPSLTAAWQMAWRNISAYVWQLPVTTEIARKGGVDMYGYPKFIADITFEKRTDAITCTLSENEETILALTGKILPVRREKVTRFTTYSVIDGIPLKANVLINPIQFAQSMAKTSAAIELGSHPIARMLKTFELSRKPITYQYSPLNQGILFAGRNLIDD